MGPICDNVGVIALAKDLITCRIAQSGDALIALNEYCSDVLEYWVYVVMDYDLVFTHF